MDKKVTNKEMAWTGVRDARVLSEEVLKHPEVWAMLSVDEDILKAIIRNLWNAQERVEK